MKQLFGGTNNNSMNPLLIGDAMFQQRGAGPRRSWRGRRNMAAQNWLTN